jgi:hypothetical protein
MVETRWAFVIPVLGLAPMRAVSANWNRHRKSLVWVTGSASVTTYDSGLHRTAASRSEGESVIACIVNKVLAMIAPWAGGEPRAYAARFVVLALSLVFAISRGNAAELLESVRLVNGGAILSCDYARPDDRFTFTCRDAHTVFALRCVSVAWSALSGQRDGQQEFLCPVSADRFAFGNALRLRCSPYGAPLDDELYSRDERWRAAPNPRLLVEGRMPTHQCDSAKVDVE